MGEFATAYLEYEMSQDPEKTLAKDSAASYDRLLSSRRNRSVDCTTGQHSASARFVETTFERQVLHSALLQISCYRLDPVAQLEIPCFAYSRGMMRWRAPVHPRAWETLLQLRRIDRRWV